jgi:NAD-dependent DNA ligase
MAIGDELHEYFHLTGRQRRDTALHVLEGLLVGLGMDHVINPREHRELRDWITDHERLADRDISFRELLNTLKEAMADGVLEPDEVMELCSLCQRAKSTSQYYDWATHAVQELHGILHGVVADMTINKAELVGLASWLERHSDLRGLWPLTEVESVVMKVLSDQQVDESEHRLMLHFFSEFTDNPAIKDALPPLLPTELTVKGVCAVDPEIVLADRTFCFTGISSKGPRRLFADEVTRRGGQFIDVMREDLDYLIIGDEGNPCWAFTCYGRKVERAVHMRRSGHRVMLVHERDFWDAIA